ncbi:MAG: DUF3857 and transglutaminase domain-containing protein [Bacteroidales bacterium]|jgi:hypothetical protein|nr:DUF3857 and transglutaminase domain-containing protein [Bacteroidales bacterium]
MKRTFFIICTLFLSCSVARAQVKAFTFEYGKVTQYELNFTDYPLAPDAEAVMIYENGDYHFTTDHQRGRFELVMVKSLKLKILKQAGIKYAGFEIPLYADNSDPERLSAVEGTTYNMENGNMSKASLERRNIFEEKRDGRHVVMKFAMPDVREGSVVELTYTVTTPYYFNMREWSFQYSIPVLHSELRYRAIPYYEYIYIAKGVAQLKMEQKLLNNELQFGNLRYKELQYKISLDSIPAFCDEDFIASVNDYRISLNFQLATIYRPDGNKQRIMSSWPEICNELLKHDKFGKYMKAAEIAATSIVNSLGINDKSDIEKLQIITHYVRQNFSWDGQTSCFASMKAPDFLRQKTGNSADLNLFLAAMLRAARLDVSPLALSTREHGLVNPEYPFIHMLNYTLPQVAVGDSTILLDATDPWLGYDELPARCINVLALQVKDNAETWHEIRQKQHASTEKSFHISLAPETARITAGVNVSAYGFDAWEYRWKCKGNYEHLSEMLQKEDETVTGVSVTGWNDTEKPVTFSYAVTATPAKDDADGIYIRPFLNQSLTANIFRQATRTLPVDLITFKAGRYHSIIDLPDGYTAGFLPEKTGFSNKLMDFGYEARINGRQIEVTGYYLFKQNVYSAREYPVIKIYYETVVKKFNEEIVIEKQRE